MEEFLKVVGAGVVILFAVAGIVLITAWPTQLAWNYVMPALFGFKTITFWQAFALNWLASTFFKSTVTQNKS